MAQVTSPIILDSTGQQIHSDLQQIKNALTTPSAAADISFDNTGTGMQADDVQDAITELKSNLTNLISVSSDTINVQSSPTTHTKVGEVVVPKCKAFILQVRAEYQNNRPSTVGVTSHGNSNDVKCYSNDYNISVSANFLGDTLATDTTFDIYASWNAVGVNKVTYVVLCLN